MMKNIRVLLQYVKDYGLINTLIFVLYKLKPRYFSILSMRFLRSGAVDAGSIEYKTLIDEVHDFKSWEEFEGFPFAFPCEKHEGKVFIWFVPDWTNVWGGGHYTLFRFANHFAHHGTRNIIYIYNNQRHKTPVHLQNELNCALIDCLVEVVVDPKKLPECDGAIATTWQSAYPVRAFPFAKHKFYFMQDYESLFYAFGTASMQANATYGFGFTGITGGGWLKQCYESHGGKAQNYRFAADRKIFYPSDKNGLVRDTVKKIFFYGRPSTERRCFALGIAALAKIAEKYPEIELVIAGLDLDSMPPFKVTCLGNLTLAGTGDLYRTCDIGIAFSGTNLSYLPVELMASGVPVISNNGPHIEWHCKNEYNSLLVDPVPQAVLDCVTGLVESKSLRQKLVDGGLETMKELDWDDQMEKIYQYVDSNLKNA
jgi:O-antigen biosynthesis protein